MKIVLASYFQPENHGSGKKIGISPGKPQNLQKDHGYDCTLQYPDLSPGQVYWDYMAAKKNAKGADKNAIMKTAGENFQNGYRALLQKFCDNVKQKAKDTNTSVFNVVGLSDGDTLLSWELEGNTTFRSITAEYLRSLGYDVEER